jgi:hypothetical protein
MPKIVPIAILNGTNEFTDRGKIDSTRFEYYLVENFNDTKETEAFIDSFAFHHLNPEFNKYYRYVMTFYKKTKATTIENLEKTNGVRGENLDDRIYEYTWSNNKFAGKIKLKDGVMVEDDKKIKVTPINQ